MCRILECVKVAIFSTRELYDECMREAILSKLSELEGEMN